MKVTDRPDASRIQDNRHKVDPARRGREQNNAPAPEAGRDRVEVSETARALSRLRSEIGRVEDVRPERVERVRKALSEGTLQVSPRAVARSLLSEVLRNLLAGVKGGSR